MHTIVYNTIAIEVEIVEDHTGLQLLDRVPMFSDHVRKVTWNTHRSNYYSSVFKPMSVWMCATETVNPSFRRERPIIAS